MSQQDPGLGNDYYKRRAEIHLASAQAATARVVELETEVHKLQRHVELLKADRDEVPINILAKFLEAVPEESRSEFWERAFDWVEWFQRGEFFEPADEPCPDCGEWTLEKEVNRDGAVLRHWCECGYEMAELGKVQP